MRFVLFSLGLPLLLLLLPISRGQRIWRNYGPLFEATKLLIAAQSLQAAQLWNETQQAISQRKDQVHQAMDILDDQQRQVNYRLELFFRSHDSAEFRACYKQNERKVAHLNRELIDKYNICRKSLDIIMHHFEQEIVQEAHFMELASFEIDNLTQICKVWQLKQLSINQAGVLLCTVSGIGSINQHMAASLELCVDILLEMSSEELDTPSCQGYQQLKLQFDEVSAEIETCIQG